MDKKEILDRLSDEPDGWLSADNRMIAHLIISLRKQNVADEVIYQTICDVEDAKEARCTNLGITRRRSLTEV